MEVMREIQQQQQSSHRVEVRTCQVIAAEGEQKASKALKEASDIITESPAALQLRQDIKISQYRNISVSQYHDDITLS